MKYMSKINREQLQKALELSLHHGHQSLSDCLRDLISRVSTQLSLQVLYIFTSKHYKLVVVVLCYDTVSYAQPCVQTCLNWFGLNHLQRWFQTCSNLFE